MRTVIVAAALLVAIMSPVLAHSARLEYFTKPKPMIVDIGDKPRTSGQVVVLTDSNVHERFNIHHMHNIYVVCRKFPDYPCDMVVIVGDQVIEQIGGRPVVHRTKGSPWKF